MEKIWASEENGVTLHPVEQPAFSNSSRTNHSKIITGTDGCLLTLSNTEAWALAVSASCDGFVVRPVKNVEKSKDILCLRFFSPKQIF